MSAERLIALIEEQRLLPDRLLDKLRAKVGETDQPMSAATLAKFLVQKRHLTSRQASELLAVLPLEIKPDAPRGRAPSPSSPSAGSAVPAEASDITGGDSSIFASLLSGSRGSKDDEEVFTLTPIEEDEDPQQAQQRADELSRLKLAPVEDLEELSASKQSLPEIPKLMEEALGHDVYLTSGAGALRASPSSVIRQRTEDKVKKEVAKRSAARTGAPVPTLRKKTKRKNQWDSPFLLIGGGVLALLLFCGGTVALILNWRGGDEKLSQARQFRDAGSFNQAVGAYEEFVSDFPTHDMWSAARVELAMTRLRQAVEGGGSLEPALRIAQAELKSLEEDPHLDQDRLAGARLELAELLPRIASGLAEQAEASTGDAAQVERLTKAAGEALSLCRNAKYVSKEFRDEVALGDIEEKLARVSRRQQTGTNLDKGLAAIKSSIESGDIRTAYTTHRQLLEDHPELSTNDQLKAIIVDASAAEKAGVKFVVDEQAAETVERATPWIAALAIGNRKVIQTPPATGTYCARIDGALYAFDVATGQLLWRRYIGFAPNSPPVQVGTNVLVVDAKYLELLCLEARSGKLLWRQSFEEPIATPLAVEDRAFVAAESGRLYLVDLGTGTRMGYLQFAQPLRVPPIVDRTREHLYLTGDHSSIYTISLADLTCVGVYYLGHSSGSIRVPPAQVLDRLAIVENDGVSTCRMRLLTLDDRGAVAKVETERRLTGLAASPPLVTSRRLIIVTDRGQLEAYDVGSGEGQLSLTQVATREPTSKLPLVRHVLLTQGAIWIGDRQLTKYAVVPTGNRLPVQSIEDSFVHSTFDHPLGLFDSVLVHVRRLDDRAGVVVAAIDDESGRVLWENELAVPPAATPIVDEARGTLVFADVNGLIYRFDDETIRAKVQDQPLSAGPAPSNSPKLTVGVDLGRGRTAFTAPGESDQLLLYDPANRRQPLRREQLPSTITCAMSPFGKGVLVPLEIGQVFYLDPANGQALAAPFQPRLQPRMKVPYQPAAQADEAGRQFVITDGHEKLYLVELVDHPQPHFNAIKEASVGAFPIVSPIIVKDDTALAVTDGGQLAQFSLPTLEPVRQTDLPSDVAWGPYVVGELVLVVTTNNQLVAVTVDGSIAWGVDVEAGELAGPPLAAEDSVMLTYRKGILERRGLDDGQPIGTLDVEHPLAAGPVRLNNRVVLTAHDGTLLVVEQP